MSQFEHVLFSELALDVATPQAFESQDFSELAVGGRFLDVIKKIFESIDVSSLTKEEFLSAVSKAFDAFVAPMLSSTPFGMILTRILKSLVMGMASRFYDNHSPGPVPNPNA